jgi:hypothetical protein
MRQNEAARKRIVGEALLPFIDKRTVLRRMS